MLRAGIAKPEKQPVADLPGLTPTQDIMIDLLVARHRLGEPFWPVSTQLTRTYTTLEQKGYVEVYSGHVEGTVRIALTAAAKQKLIESSDYLSPIMRLAATHIADSLEMSGADPTTVRMIRKQFARG